MTPDRAYEMEPLTQEARYAAELHHNAQADILKNNHLMIGQRVRILEYKGNNRLGNDTSSFWSKEIYSVARREGFKWYVQDHAGKELRRRYKINELQRVVGSEVRDAAGAEDVRKANKQVKVARVMRQQEQLEPASREPSELDDAELQGKTLGDLSIKVGQWMAVDAEGTPEGTDLLRFKKAGKDCFVWVGRVSKVTKDNVHVRNLSAEALKDRRLGSRFLRLRAVVEALAADSPAESVLYLGAMAFNTKSAGAVSKAVQGTIKANYVTA
jgi:hypothetical protein